MAATASTIGACNSGNVHNVSPQATEWSELIGKVTPSFSIEASLRAPAPINRSTGRTAPRSPRQSLRWHEQSAWLAPEVPHVQRTAAARAPSSEGTLQPESRQAPLDRFESTAQRIAHRAVAPGTILASFRLCRPGEVASFGLDGQVPEGGGAISRQRPCSGSRFPSEICVLSVTCVTT